MLPGIKFIPGQEKYQEVVPDDLDNNDALWILEDLEPPGLHSVDHFFRAVAVISLDTAADPLLYLLIQS